ncbi:MAG: type II toxin-antitoxin system VapC family toxin [Terriglobia bacterium]
MIYVDTSVLAAYYCPEPLSEQAQRALAQEDERAISSLVELEFVSALARKVRTHEMHRQDAHRILAVFQSHLEEGIYTRLGVDAAHFGRAREWLATFVVPLHTLDALHVALAAMKGCSLMTADAPLAQACAKVGVTARLID